MPKAGLTIYQTLGKDRTNILEADNAEHGGVCDEVY